MRKTLEELKAMSDGQLNALWRSAEFPFDKMTCRHCLTGHNPGYPEACRKHEQVVEQMRKFPFEAGWNLHPYVEELYALRLFYDSLYPQSALTDSALESTPAPQAEVAHVD